ncbi:hypothetical protein GCM10009682_37900 [Luedemannella flava]|uniref:Uncharacterized protein n=1 Tax=Luedemannella flava TaxID=349316 RepID=A0ABP4YH99_9ACTN
MVHGCLEAVADLLGPLVDADEVIEGHCAGGRQQCGDEQDRARTDQYMTNFHFVIMEAPHNSARACIDLDTWQVGRRVGARSGVAAVTLTM